MNGILRSRRGTTLLTTLCTLLIIQSIEGHLSLWSSYLPYEKQLDQESLRTSDDSVSVAEDSEDAATTASESGTVRSSEPFPADTGQRVTEIFPTTYNERAFTFPNENNNSGEDSDEDKDEEDRNHDDFDDTEADYNNTNTKNRMDHNKTIINGYDSDATNMTADELIAEALKEHILLTPELLESFKRNGAHNNISTFTKMPKTRSPKHSNEIDPRMNVNVNSNDDGIVFPDDRRLNMSGYDFFNAPVPSCEGTTYCETVPYYPSAEFMEIALRNNYIPPISDPDVNTISQRMNPEDPVICKSKSQPIVPRSGIDANKEWRYILNNETYEQKLQVELCEDECERCHNIIPDGLTYTTYCEQKYIYRTLVVYKVNAVDIELAPIKIPSSCCCNIRHTGDSSVRMMLDETTKECVVDSVRIK